MVAKLTERRILVLEDEPLVALEVAAVLVRHGATVVGPAGDVASARQLIAGSQIDGAVLDVNLGHESVAPLARELGELKIPFVFLTGYDERDMSPLWRSHPILRKPMVAAELVDALTHACLPSPFAEEPQAPMGPAAIADAP
jgi:DNA-binding LytR/AlgR family response regulator